MQLRGIPHRGYPPHLGTQLLGCVPEIVGQLHTEPQSGTVAAEFSEPKRHFRSHGCALRQYAMQRLARDAKMGRSLGNGHP